MHNAMTEIGTLRQNMAALMRRSAVDEDFRCLALEDAVGAYREFTGQALPGEYAVRFIEPGIEPGIEPVQEAPASGSDGGGMEGENSASGNSSTHAKTRCVCLPPLLRKTWLG